MSKPISFGELGDFSAGEVAFIIEHLAALVPQDEIQDLFYKFTNEKRHLPGTVIQQIQLKYADKIKRQSEAYLNNIQGSPLAYQRVRLDMYYRIIREAMKPEPTHSIKTGENEFIIVYKNDKASALNALKLTVMDLNEREKLDNKTKEGPKGQPIPEENVTSWEIKDGISD